MAVLLVLDDLWLAAHAKPLNFVHGAALRSAVVVTTRMRNLLEGAHEVRAARALAAARACARPFAQSAAFFYGRTCAREGQERTAPLAHAA